MRLQLRCKKTVSPRRRWATIVAGMRARRRCLPYSAPGPHQPIVRMGGANYLEPSRLIRHSRGEPAMAGYALYQRSRHNRFRRRGSLSSLDAQKNAKLSRPAEPMRSQGATPGFGIPQAPRPICPIQALQPRGGQHGAVYDFSSTIDDLRSTLIALLRAALSSLLL